jgi:group I intron endonuclease
MLEVYIVYKTTNKVNGKFYIGVHKCNSLDKFDGYFGSGSLLKKAILKYGNENFSRETLYVFDTYKEAYIKEQEIVNSLLIESDTCYNLKLGGKGGPRQNTNVRKKFSLDRKGKFVKGENHFFGKTHAEESKEKMRIAKIGKYVGDKNPNWKGGKTRKKFTSEEERQQVQSKLMKENNPMHNLEVKKRHLEKMKNKIRKICPHCNKSMEMGGFTVHKNALFKKGIII